MDSICMENDSEILHEVEHNSRETRQFYSKLLDTLEEFRKTSRFTDGVLVGAEKEISVHLNVLASVYPRWAKQIKTNKSCPNRIYLNSNTSGTIDRFIELLYKGVRINDCALERTVNCQNVSQSRENNEAFGDCKEEKKDEQLILLHVKHTFQDLRNAGIFCDVNLLTDDGDTSCCHRNVLAAHSPYFNGLFTSAMKEKDQELFDFTFFNPLDFKEVINYMYTGQLTITNNNAMTLLEISDYLLMEALKQKISLFVASNYLSVNTCWSILKMAQTYNSSALCHLTEEFICEEITNITQTEEFLEVDAEAVEWLVSKESLYTEETVLLGSIVRWFRHNNDTNKTKLRHLLSYVHFHSIPNDMQPSEMRNLESVLHIITNQDALNVSIDSSTRRPTTPTNLCVIATVYNEVKVWLPRYNHVITLCSLPRALPVVTVYGHDQVFIIGGALNGRQQEGCSTEVLCYGLTKSSCEARSPMRMGVMHPALCTVGQRIYVIGGENEMCESQKTVQVYDTGTDTWQLAGELNEVHCAPCVVTFKDKYIYVIGGHTGRSKHNRLTPLRSVERYDPRHNRWTYVAPMNEPRIDARGFVFRDKLFVLGGFNCISTALDQNCESYDPLTCEWKLLSPFCCVSQIHAVSRITCGRLFLLEKTVRKHCHQSGLKKASNTFYSLDPLSGDTQIAGSITQRSWEMTSPSLRYLNRGTLTAILTRHSTSPW